MYLLVDARMSKDKVNDVCLHVGEILEGAPV